MSKALLQVETQLTNPNKVEVSLAQRGPLWSSIDVVDLIAQPAWVWEYPSGKIYRLKNYKPYQEPWYSVSVSAKSPDEVDWASMFEYVGEDKRGVARAFQQLQTNDSVWVENFPGDSIH